MGSTTQLNKLEIMDKSDLWSDEDESTSSEIESQVNEYCSDLSQEIDTKMISDCELNHQPDDSLDSESDDIYESLLRSPERLESPKTENENDPISELEAFLKAHDEGNVTKVNESLIEKEKLKNPAKENSDQQSAGIPMETGSCSFNGGIRRLRREGINSTGSKRVLRPRSKIYWNESSLFYLKTQANMYSYYSGLRKKRI